MRQFKLDKIKATGTTVGDVHFPKVICLLSFDGGSNGSTTLTDLSNNSLTINAESGAQISTAESKWGSSSLFLDGTNDYVELNSLASSLSSASAFTIEGWFKLPQSDEVGVLWGINTSSGGNVLWPLVNGDSSMKINAGATSSSFSISPVNIRDGNWHHVAVTHDGSNNYDLYVDGNKYKDYTGSSSYSSNDKIQIGMEYDTSTKGDYCSMYCNDFRVSNFRRYTDSTYTVPTAAFLTSAGDVNKHIVVNSDADGVAIGTGGINQARIAKAWINLDSTQAAASMIRESYNVSSMTDTATGRYTINFSTALSNANYCFAGSAGNNTSTTTNGRDITNDGTRTTSALPIRVTRDNDVAVEDSYVGVIVFGN